MDTTPDDGYVESFEVDSSTSTSIQVKWTVQGAVVAFIDYFRVHYQKVASTYVQYGPKLPATTNVYEIRNLVADTYYKVCLVTKRNDTGPIRQCVDASTTNWQLPVSIGSSIGAILALSIIVLIVLLSRCQIPYRYRKKIKTEPGKYDAMSSNFHDERYFDFSETVTQGNDDDFTSEMEPEESGYYEQCNYEVKCPRKPGERFSYANGNVKSTINTHPYLLNQRRHSLGRIYVHGHGAHHTRPMPVRALSMQTDQHPCSPLAKESEHRHSDEKDWRHHDTDSPQPALRVSQDMKVSDPLEQHLRQNYTDLNKLTPSKKERILQKQKSINEHDTLLCSSIAQDFLYIDEVQDSTKMLTTDSNENSSSLRSELKLNDDTFGDINEYDTTAFQRDISGHKRPKPVEMTTKGRLKLLHDHGSMEEHAV